MSTITLRRYTNLAAAVHCLRNRCLTLLNPASWDDRNDAYFMAEFKRRTEARTVLALCFAEAPETYHHWRVFSPGNDGICMELHKDQVEQVIGDKPGLTMQKVQYREISDVCAEPIEARDLPYIKRYPYKDEEELRMVFTHQEKEMEDYSIPIPLACIRRITLSPWLAKPLENSVMETIKEIRGCAEMSVFRSTLIENERWKRAANPDLHFHGSGRRR